MTTSALPITPARHARVLFLEVHGGYLDGLRITFAAHTSCIIGGKGSGKTTVFELLRFVFGATALLGKDAAFALLKKNLGTGYVRAGYETKHGVRYVFERKLREEKPRIFTPDGEPVKLGADVELFEGYGQDEIERVGEDRLSQRRLIDRLAGDAIRPHLAEIARVTEEQQSGAKLLLALEAEIALLESGAAEARAIEEQLKPLLTGSGADAAILVRGHAAKGLRAREKQTLAAADAVIGESRAKVEALSASLRTKLAAVVTEDVRAGANGALFAELGASLDAVAGALAALSSTVGGRTEETQSAFAGWKERLTAVHAAQDADYDALVARQKEDQARIDERTRLQERLAVVAGAIPLLEEKTRAHAALRGAQDELAERLLEVRDARTAARTAVREQHEETLERDGVRIRIKADDEQDAYRALLSEVFKPITGGQPKWLVDKIAPSIRPDELVAIVRAQDTASLVARAGLAKHAERAREVIGALTPNHYLYALQSVAIDDEVIIEARHGEVWKDTVECSPGQRSGAILPLLLLVGDTPLAIDQPDDNVDPEFMCESILPRVVALRGARQFIFVTHHANVPVLSGADQVVLIESNGRSAGLRAEGGLVPMKDHLLSGLEGGGNAFERRKRTYEGIPAPDLDAPEVRG